MTSVADNPRTDYDIPLSPLEQSELELNDFIRHLVFNEGKFGKDDGYFNMPALNWPQNWSLLHHMMNEYEKRNRIDLDIADLGEYLDLASYIEIIKSYVRMYSPENERKRNLVAIISIMVFVRVYARLLKQRAAEEEQSEQYTERDLERLSTYTAQVVGTLLSNGLELHWDEFCKELRQYSISDVSQPFTGIDPRAILLTASLFGCVVGICWFFIRSHLWSAKH